MRQDGWRRCRGGAGEAMNQLWDSFGSRKGKIAKSPPELQEEWSSLDPVQTSDLHDYKVMNLNCFNNVVTY